MWSHTLRECTRSSLGARSVSNARHDGQQHQGGTAAVLPWPQSAASQGRLMQLTSAQHDDVVLLCNLIHGVQRVSVGRGGYWLRSRGR